MSDPTALHRSVSELMLLYQLEPSTRHVFVEGKMDKAIISHFVMDLGLAGDVLRLDEYVDMSELLATDVPKTGVRARLEMLAHEFDSRFEGSDSGLCLTCIIDLDDGAHDPTDALLTTDYADMELYVWEAKRFTKLLQLSLGIDDEATIESLMASATERAMVSCRCRRIVHEMQLGARPPTRLTRFACPQSGVFDVEGYLRAFGSGVARHAPSIAARVRSEVRDTPPEQARLFMNGHDLIPIVATLLTKTGRKLTSIQLELLWFTVLVPRDLAQEENLFANLVQRLTV